jgi:hypothetical protein
MTTMGGSSILPAPTVATTALVLLIVLFASPATVAKGSGLSVGFYKKLCPKAEKVVRRTVTKAFEKEPGTPADIIRLFFHDCFVRVSRSLMFGLSVWQTHYLTFKCYFHRYMFSMSMSIMATLANIIMIIQLHMISHCTCIAGSCDLINRTAKKGCHVKTEIRWLKMNDIYG